MGGNQIKIANLLLCCHRPPATTASYTSPIKRETARTRDGQGRATSCKAKRILAWLRASYADGAV